MSISPVRKSGYRVRFGGFPGPEGYVFELSGGRLCLDFINTVDYRLSAEPRELLPAYTDIVSWAGQAGILNPREARDLLRSARRQKPAAAALTKARALREALFAIFSAVARGERAPEGALLELQSRLPAAFAMPEIVTHAGYELVWRDDLGALDGLLSPVVRSAIELLTAPEADRVRICAADECGWLFLDESRNRSRQWCDMSVCGNRAKARRFYTRHRAVKRRRARRARRRDGKKR